MPLVPWLIQATPSILKLQKKELKSEDLYCRKLQQRSMSQTKDIHIIAETRLPKTQAVGRTGV